MQQMHMPHVATKIKDKAERSPAAASQSAVQLMIQNVLEHYVNVPLPNVIIGLTLIIAEYCTMNRIKA